MVKHRLEPFYRHVAGVEAERGSTQTEWQTKVMKEEKLQTERKNKEKAEEDGGWWEACQRRSFVVGQKPPRDY